MGKISEKDFVRIVDGVIADRELIFHHNPIGTEEETLLWMVMSCLINYLGLTDKEMPCFPGTPTAETYRQAITYIVAEHRESVFDPTEHLGRIC